MKFATTAALFATAQAQTLCTKSTDCTAWAAAEVPAVEVGCCLRVETTSWPANTDTVTYDDGNYKGLWALGKGMPKADADNYNNGNPVAGSSISFCFSKKEIMQLQMDHGMGR